MKKNTKAFTLIELLAVIVILAIIALISTPMIINVIENARRKAFEDSAYGVLEGLKLDYVERISKSEKTNEKLFSFPSSELKLSGEQPAGGSAKIDEKGIISFAIFDKDKRWCAQKAVNKEKITMSDYNDANCKIDGTSGGGNASIPNLFATDSWDTISSAVKTGNMGKYNVGDEKEVRLEGYKNGNEETYTVRIANVSTPNECNNSNFSQSACGFVVEFKDIITESLMSSHSNENGWPHSEMYEIVNKKIYNALPQDLKKVIKDTKVVSSYGKLGYGNYISTDKLYLLSTKEVSSNIIDHDTSNDYTRQLDHYKSKGVTIKNYSELIKQYNGVNSNWWLRSAASYSRWDYYYINSTGNFGCTGSGYVTGVSPAFRIG